MRKAERDAFRDFSRTTSNMSIKFDPNHQNVRTKTNIKIKDIDFSKHRAKLKITTGRSSDHSMLSKEEEESEYD